MEERIRRLEEDYIRLGAYLKVVAFFAAAFGLTLGVLFKRVEAASAAAANAKDQIEAARTATIQQISQQAKDVVRSVAAETFAAQVIEFKGPLLKPYLDLFVETGSTATPMISLNGKGSYPQPTRIQANAEVWEQSPGVRLQGVRIFVDFPGTESDDNRVIKFNLIQPGSTPSPRVYSR